MSDPLDFSYQNPDTTTPNKKEKNTAENKDNNDIDTCAGGLTDEKIKELQAELDRAKEDNSFSTKSRCVIS